MWSLMMMPLRLASNSKSNITIEDYCGSIETHQRTQHNDPIRDGTQQNDLLLLYSDIDVVTNWGWTRTYSASTRMKAMQRGHGNSSGACGHE
jgi:hypothetical protein